MTDKLQRPESFEFALDFLGGPENDELLAYIEQLEARAALSAPTRAEGVGELALELELMANRAADDSRLGDAHFLSRAAAVIQGQWVEIKRLKASAHQPAPPAEGEVGEVVKWLTMLRDHDLRHDAACAHPAIADHWNDFLTRAADLLAQRHPAPVPVSERLPRPGDCNEMGQCWWFDAEVWCFDIYDHEYTHWIPANALPLPAWEAQP